VVIGYDKNNVRGFRDKSIGQTYGDEKGCECSFEIVVHYIGCSDYTNGMPISSNINVVSIDFSRIELATLQLNTIIFIMKTRLSTSGYSILLPVLIAIITTIAPVDSFGAKVKPNIVLVMTDDQGWGQTGYYNHPVLRTPNLDKMTANGLRFDRFYAGAPNCSPTRATVLTGRSNRRTGVDNHGYPLRLQEKTLP